VIQRDSQYFIAFIIIAAFYFFLFGKNKQKNGLITFSITCLVFLVVLFFSTIYLELLESGFDDGPFYPLNSTVSLDTCQITTRLPYRNGDLIVLNGSNFDPLIIYAKNNQVVWCQKLKPDNGKIDSLTNISISPGLFKDVISFTAYWTYGGERGYGYIWKFGSIQYYFLSW